MMCEVLGKGIKNFQEILKKKLYIGESQPVFPHSQNVRRKLCVN